MQRVAVAAVMVLYFQQATAGEDKVAERLAAAKETYAKAVGVARERLEGELEKLAGQARTKGDKAAADRIRAEQSAFRDSKTLPQSISLSAYRQSTLSAADRLATEYARAIKAYTKKNDLQTAGQMETELVNLQREHNRFWRHKKGYFIRTGDRTWEELDPEQTRHRFTEIARTLDYVELERSAGSVRVRLYSNRCDVSGRPFSSSKTYYEGEWAVE